MIDIKKINDNIIVSGHAGFDNCGRDIVCAGVSTLIETFILAAISSGVDCSAYKTSGYCFLSNLGNEKIKDFLKMFIIGVGSIALTYPEHVRLNAELWNFESDKS